MRLAIAALAPSLLLAASLAACTQTRRPIGAGPATAMPGNEPAYLNPPGIPGLEGFTQAVQRGMTIYVSGQVALDTAGQVVGAGDLRRQTEEALQHLLAVVRSARGLPDDVVQMTIYVVNYQPEQFATIREVSASLFPPGRAPAVTLVGVAALPKPGLLIAVDGVAVLRSQFLDRQRLREQTAQGQAYGE